MAPLARGKREALKIEERAKAEAKAKTFSRNDSTQLALDIAIDRFWTEWGEMYAGGTIRRSLFFWRQRPLNGQEFQNRGSGLTEPFECNQPAIGKTYVPYL
jgi:hypothetical protein